ncbi:MAG TPA: TonB-dependent receptor plug domain-containing protein, partial [Myxococcaceae bacterium]|nr:TonB-dependent receptor plug domain-containing protein [Myxococcaceae bacterium]
MKSHRGRVAFIAVALSPPAFAEAPDAATPPAVFNPAENYDRFSLEEVLRLDVPTVTSVSKRAEKSTASPATVYVITRDDIRIRGYRFLTDVLRDAPGMEAIEFAFSETGTNVPVRGVVGNNKIIVLVNGMRVNPPGGE